jgi:hypothetical protein
MPIILATWEADIGKTEVQGQLRQIVHKTPIPKITTAKWTGSVAQEIEYLLCKCEALTLNSSSTRKKKCAFSYLH